MRTLCAPSGDSTNLGDPSSSASSHSSDLASAGEGRGARFSLVLFLSPWQTPLVPHEDVKAEGARLNRLWAVGLVYTLFVILFGAVVRITGSGAGCGQHWPSCKGEIAHLPQSVETMIELTHRVTSGLSMVLIFVLAYLSFRRFGRSHPATKAALYSCFFMIVEALVGAALVLLELVGENDSVARAIIMALHLVNTMALVAAIVVSLWAAGHPKISQLDLSLVRLGFWAYGGAVALAVVSATGAVTALGDTLYPVSEISQAASSAQERSHFLNLLRGVHPLVAVLGAAIVIFGAGRLTDVEERKGERDAPVGPRTKVARAVVALVILQVFLGLVNIALSAPGWMQVVHLGCANLIWIAWIWGWLHVASEASDQTPGVK